MDIDLNADLGEGFGPWRMGEDEALLVLPDGSATVCPLHNLSISGASVETPARPPLGAEVMLDKRRATVIRHHERGLAVEFVNEHFTSGRNADATLRGPLRR